MTDFSEAILEKKLTELRDSQKEIQSLSQYCVQHRQHCKLIVKVEKETSPITTSVLTLTLIS